VTERGLPLADGASACPFVAFADDRDERASVPDHRHRCYAETRPAPRALAHQEAYCLSSAFPVCPTFQDWARREAARARDAADAAAVRDAAIAAGAGAAGTAAAEGAAAMTGAAAGGADEGDPPEDLPAEAGPTEPGPDQELDDRSSEDRGLSRPVAEPTRPGADDSGRDADADEFGARRNPPRDWAAPPPWLASDASGAGRPEGSPPPFLSHRSSEPGQGLAGSAADRLAGGPAPVAEPDADAAAALAAAAAASAARAAAGGGSGQAGRRHYADEDRSGDEASRDDDQPRRPTRRPRAYEQHLGGTDDGPDWERPRRYEAYPTIKTRVGLPNPPRLAVMAGAIIIAAIALLFLPTILGFGSTPGPAASGSPSAGAGTPSPVVTDAPGPTPFIYTIKKNETLLKIASNHGITLEQLLAANPQIKNPNKIAEGQQITIPAPSAAPPDQFGGSPSPSAQ